jgi:hypothetical protein
MEERNLWILTEERPKIKVIAWIFEKFIRDNNFACFLDSIRVLPILENNKKFSFKYKVDGLSCVKVNNVYIKIVSGYSSFVDYLVFYQKNEPTQGDIPLYAIEETKTDDKESRNTGVFQRATKFVYLDLYYDNMKKTMLYNLQIKQGEEPTDTYIFGTRCLLTLGVEIAGKTLDPKIFVPFTDIDELIAFKSRMRRPPRGNVPIDITKEEGIIKVSGRLIKSDTLAHDPNIGALSLICATLRKLGWKNDIIITSHGLSQNHLNADNKFIKIANLLDIKLENLHLPLSIKNNRYWKYETGGEKLGTIFIHLVVETFSNGCSIFENHAGCEKGYFITKDGKPIPLQKYTDRAEYKKGNKDEIVYIPDLILLDFDRTQIINIEGKKYEFRNRAIEELNDFEPIEELYIKKYYKGYVIKRTVVLYGGSEERIQEMEVGFLLNKHGGLILGIMAPELFKEAIKNLINFWFN